MQLAAVLRATGADKNSLSEERTGAIDRRGTGRRSLRLSASTSTLVTGDISVLIRDISPGGLLIEAEVGSLSVDDSITVSLPDDRILQGRVAWASGRFFGCEFRSRISEATVSAALLRADPQVPENAPAASAIQEMLTGRARFVPELNFSVAFYVSLGLWALIGATIYLLVR